MESDGKARGSDFLYLALYAFAGFAFELVLAFLIEPALGLSIDSLTTGQSIIHWLVTCLVWLVVSIVLVRVAKNKYGFDIWEAREPMKGWQYAAAALGIVVMTCAQYLDWGGFKPLLELEEQGPLKFVFQYVYYFFETVLFSLIIIFGQRACEIWFKRKNVPYGGIVLALTWGLGHILSKGSVAVGLLSAVGVFLMGASYLIVGRDYRKALPLLYVMFVI
jgi:hypothetical protein